MVVHLVLVRPESVILDTLSLGDSIWLAAESESESESDITFRGCYLAVAGGYHLGRELVFQSSHPHDYKLTGYPAEFGFNILFRFKSGLEGARPDFHRKFQEFSEKLYFNFVMWSI